MPPPVRPILDVFWTIVRDAARAVVEGVEELVGGEDPDCKRGYPESSTCCKLAKALGERYRGPRYTPGEELL